MKRVLAALIFFTRLPFWRLLSLSNGRIANIDKKYYEQVVPLWPLVGWLTGGIMALVFYLCHLVLPVSVAVIAALISRVLVTGALHEDGFADFCDGMGGGSTGSPTASRERTLEIMKDSHIGTYGVLGLILYYILIYDVLTEIFTANYSLFTIHYSLFIAADSAAKMVSSSIVWFLPYARKESEAKNKLVYTDTPVKEKLLSIILGMLPIILLCLFGDMDFLPFFAGLCATIIVAAILFKLMDRRIQGYTGDCCGATFIILETIFYLTLLITI